MYLRSSYAARGNKMSFRMRQGIADAEQTYKLAAARRTADLWAGKPSSPEEDVTSSDNSDSDGVSSSVRVDSGGDTSSL